jgi:hypothetical protein
MTGVISEETLAEQNAQLTRQLDHRESQCQTAHRMAMYYRAKYKACEAERSRLAKQLTPKAEQQANTRNEEKQDDINARFGLFAGDEDDTSERNA